MDLYVHVCLYVYVLMDMCMHLYIHTYFVKINNVRSRQLKYWTKLYAFDSQSCISCAKRQLLGLWI